MWCEGQNPPVRSSNLDFGSPEKKTQKLERKSERVPTHRARPRPDDRPWFNAPAVEQVVARQLEDKFRAGKIIETNRTRFRGGAPTCTNEKLSSRNDFRGSSLESRCYRESPPSSSFVRGDEASAILVRSCESAFAHKAVGKQLIVGKLHYGLKKSHCVKP